LTYYISIDGALGLLQFFPDLSAGGFLVGFLYIIANRKGKLLSEIFKEYVIFKFEVF
jgi:hypothetical protein